MSIAKKFITTRGTVFRIERNGEFISTALGLPNHEKATQKPYIGMLQDADVNIGDWLVNPANDRFLVKDKIADFAFNEFQQYKIFYLTEAQAKKDSSAPASTIFNIGTATGSVIGTQSVVNMNYNDSIQNAKKQLENSSSPDKEDLKQLINLLEMIVNNQVPVSKGLFSRFSEIMERNSWITGSISSALISWLTTQPH